MRSPSSIRWAHSPATRPCKQVKAGLDAIYLSRLAGGRRRQPRGGDVPDQSLYPADSVPQWWRRINATLSARTSASRRGNDSIDWFKPIVCGCRGGLRRRAERRSTDEADDLTRAGRGSFRRPAVLRQEMRHMAARCWSRPRDAINKLAAARPSGRCLKCRPCCWRGPMRVSQPVDLRRSMSRDRRSSILQRAGTSEGFSR